MTATTYYCRDRSHLEVTLMGWDEGPFEIIAPASAVDNREPNYSMHSAAHNWLVDHGNALAQSRVMTVNGTPYRVLKVVLVQASTRSTLLLQEHTPPVPSTVTHSFIHPRSTQQ